VLFRWDAPLFFANAEVFGQDVREAIAASPTPARRVVVAAEPVTDVDTSAADVLQSLHDDLAAAGVELHFAEVKDPVKDRLRRYGLLEELGPERFHPTVGSAVDAYVAESGVAWREEDVEPNADPEGR
jgi:MFS superfamily sulfate permease-like transporter